MATITKRELVIELCNRTGQTQSHVFDIFQAALDLIAEELAKGNNIAMRRFGTLEVHIAKSRIGRNPRNPAGTQVEIPPRAVVKFKPSKELKDQVVAGVPTLRAL